MIMLIALDLISKKFGHIVYMYGIQTASIRVGVCVYTVCKLYIYVYVNRPFNIKFAQSAVIIY
jgi:hypothetical protein